MIHINIYTFVFKLKILMKNLDLEKLFYDQKLNIQHLVDVRNNDSKKIKNYSLSPYTGPFGDIQKNHLLNRTLIGKSSNDLKKIKDLTIDQVIDKIFQEEQTPKNPTYDFYHINDKDSVKQQQIERGVPDKYLKFVDNGNEYLHLNYQLLSIRYTSDNVSAWRLKNILNQNTSIHWKLWLFLHTLIPVNQYAVGKGKAMYEYTMKLFNHAFSNYKTLIYNITTDWGMLHFLNLTLSKKENPDENFARELLELYTVGKEGGSKFSENDVREVSKILTGWHAANGGEYEQSISMDEIYKDGPFYSWFDPNNHDSSDKKLSSYFNNDIVLGREGEDGKLELNDLLDIIFNNNDTSKYISRRIYQFFVNPIITNEIEEKIITPLSKVFIDSNFSISETLKVLVRSEHFFDSNNYNSMIKSPLDFFSSIFKELHLKYVQSPTAYEPGGGGFQLHYALQDPNSKDFYIYSQFQNYLVQTGFDLSFPPSVSGWKPYYQKPIYDMFWINSFTLKKRAQLSQNMVGEFHVYMKGLNTSPGTDVIQCDLYEYISSIYDFKNINSFVEGILKRFSNSNVGHETKEIIKKSILNDKSDHYWRDIIEDYERTNNKPEYDILEQKVKLVLSRVFQLEEINTF